MYAFKNAEALLFEPMGLGVKGYGSAVNMSNPQ
jgi:hypothetical protein